MTIGRRIEALEAWASQQRATDSTVPSWAAPLIAVLDDYTPDAVYAIWGAVLDAIAAGRCIVCNPGMLHARRLMVDFMQPGASYAVCMALQDWCDYLNSQWDIGLYPIEQKPHTLAEYAEWITLTRPYMAFGSTLEGDDRAAAAGPADTPEYQAIEARFVEWCNSMGITLDETTDQSSAAAH